MGNTSLFLYKFIFPLYNHSYPPRYIHSQFNKFYRNYITTSSIVSLSLNKQDFTDIRGRILDKPTTSEYELAARIAKTMNTKTREETSDPLVRAKLNDEQKWNKTVIIHYTFEQRLAAYNMTKQLVRRRPDKY